MLINLKNFAGLYPKYSDRALNANAATVANNTQLYSGEVRGLREPFRVADLSAETFTVERAYRLYDGSVSIADTVGDWIAFDDPDVNFVRGALKNDQYDRYYASGGTQQPVVAEATEWAAGNTPHDLGVPEPTVAPTVTPPASGDVDETRAYVYTFVNEWGEESAPSPASAPVTGDITGSWVLSTMQVAYPPAGNHNPLSKTRIYRTVTGLSSVDYRFVTEITPAAGYTDDSSGTPDGGGYITSTDGVSLNESLPSNSWNAPPAGLQGIVNMANGIMVGFVGRDLYFSEPYRPHTFPLAYQISVDAVIIGLGVYQSGVVVCTTSNPWVATGTHPASIALTRLDDVEPCQSFRSIVNGLDGVTYASQNGLILVNQQGASNITKPLITRNEWRESYSPATSRSAADGSRTITFTNANEGWLFQPLEPMGHLVDLSGFTDVTGVHTDPFTGEAYVISRDQIFQWNPVSTVPLNYTWKSKVFELPYPVNMGAYRLQYKDVISGGDYDPGFDYTAYNTARFDATTVEATYDLPTVVFQTDWEGTDGDSSYVEQSSNTATVQRNYSAAEIDNARAKFGSTSGFCGFAEDFWRAPDIAAYDMGADDFTWETWINLRQDVSTNDEWSIFNQWGAGGDAYGFSIRRDGAGDYFVRVRLGATTIDGQITNTTVQTSISAPGTWYHMVAERIGNTVYVGFNGFVEGSGAYSSTVPTSTELLRLGGDASGSWLSLMWLDDTRISVPGTQYGLDGGSTYTVPTTTLPAAGAGGGSITTHPLDTLNLFPINGTRVETGVAGSPPVVQFKMPVGGSPLYQNVNTELIRDSVRIRIWGDDILRYEREITSNNVMRLPSGYKADKWQIEFVTAQNIYNFKMAGTAKELAKA